MTDHHWPTIRDQANERFGETPGAQLKQDIIDHFIDDPDRVIRTIDHIAEQHTKKTFGSPWAITRSNLNRKAQADITVTATAGREKAIANAETWIRNAGLHHDRQDHVEADLFGDDYAKGPLTSHDTPELRARLIALWQQLRPLGVQAEQDHEAWNTKAKADRAILMNLHTNQHQQALDHQAGADINFD